MVDIKRKKWDSLSHCGCSDLEYCEEHRPTKKIGEKEVINNKFRDVIIDFCMFVFFMTLIYIAFFSWPLNQTPDLLIR